MAAMKQCGSASIHQFHGWTILNPEKPLGKEFYVCSGVELEPRLDWEPWMYGYGND